MSNSGSVGFSARVRAVAAVRAPDLAHRVRQWAYSGESTHDDLIVALCAEIERLAPYEEPEFPPRTAPPAAWTEKRRTVRVVAENRPELEARVTEWLQDDYPTGVDDVLIALADDLADVREKLRWANDDVHAYREERDEYDTRCMQAERRLEIAEEELERLRSLVVELEAEVSRQRPVERGDGTARVAWQRLAATGRAPRVAGA